ncbi:MAG: signal peptide peptidase SppA [Crocinitomicaceae bacterium]|nr:signal peptide peptidase SppA [Crocinitomicaceae bacterium]|tara:strand:+ start:24416 stop:26206 length:1791 start_codon:yes stop_codon:yes gene_type:complete
MKEDKISFGRIFWPSFWSAIIVSIIGIIIWIFVLGGLINIFDNSAVFEIKENSVLHMTLQGKIVEKRTTSFDPSTFQIEKTLSLSEIIHGLEEGVTDDKIKGLFIELDNVSCGFATATELRNAINEFEKSGKFAIAYNNGELITQTEYYIASAANQNYGFPTSSFSFLGLGTELSFFKNTFDKLNLEVEIIRGSNNDFKSAVEPFYREKMSDSSRLQINRYITSLWLDYRKSIAKDRKITIEELNEIANNFLIQNINDAVKYKLIDKAIYRDEVLKIIANKIGLKNLEKLNLQAFNKYAKKRFYQNQTLTKIDNPNIAVILAEGAVEKNGEELSSKEICELFKKVRKEKSIKTVIFRINSPGGSALASDEIWREVKLTNEKKKVIVSMGDVAASGGYYIASPASTIFANSTTITGSIGVFGIIPYTEKMLKNKLGITFDRESTNNHSVMTTNRKLTKKELSIIQKSVDDIYTRFKEVVSEGRNISKEQINNIARGRVWTGKDAKDIGLVDQLGGLKDAINFAAEKANIKNKKVLYYPNIEEDPIAELIEQFNEQEIKTKNNHFEVPESILKYYHELKKVESMQGIQMRLPYEINIK